MKNSNADRINPFRQSLSTELNTFLAAEADRWPEEDVLRIDLHCHDLNSDVPDELWGRILGLPETWLATEDLLRLSGQQWLRCADNHKSQRCA